MYQTIPVAQHLDRYVFATGVAYDTNYAQVIRRKNGPPVYIDGVEVTGYYLINVAGGLAAEIADWPLVGADGVAHLAESDAPFGLNVLGYVENSAYAYPAGAALVPLNPDGR